MIEQLLKMAFEEDLGDAGDITSDAIFTDKRADRYSLVAKQDGVLCGADIFVQAFNYIDKACKVKFYFSDGDTLKKGQQVAIIEGSINSLLKAERVALNFISHLSGIATQVRKWTDAISKTGMNSITNKRTKILDTRKTVPGWRSLQKYAVKCGGGTNHRMGLYDMVMIKDNHIDSAGGITKAVEMVRSKWKDRFKIEVETRTLKEVEEALSIGVDVIMLDNMDIPTMIEAVSMVDGKAATEASGNMTFDRIEAVAQTGVDYISVGALTHSVSVFDFSLRKTNS
ncbi:MAG: carboxylating nicotinate-nucleotide diphosphorylase [Desulfamplus sp.]|nr:carboxylating nicotinate-nucleotide diphosphorylase [Desulfamplus sp.]